MQNRVIVGILSSLMLVSVVGCTANKEIEKFADKECACTDKDCATKVVGEFAEWMEKNKDARGDEQKAQADAERFIKCAQDKGADLTKFVNAAK
jgi:hypothetical protein